MNFKILLLKMLMLLDILISSSRLGAITKVEKSVGWTFDRDFCYCKGAATCQNLITSCIIPLGVMYLLVIMLDQYKVSVEHHWI